MSDVPVPLGANEAPQAAGGGPSTRPRTAARAARLAGAGFAVLALFACAVLFRFDPSQHGFYPLCIFHQTTGLLCPGCGSLRALHQLLHGHLATAFHLNPLLTIALPFLAWFAIRYRAAKRQTGTGSAGSRTAWLWGFLAVAVAFGVWRNIPGNPFAL